jgi:hypothetical protein
MKSRKKRKDYEKYKTISRISYWLYKRRADEGRY